MCKYCDNKTKILSYDNHDNMKISFGQYSGVHVWSELFMNGNALVLDAGGSYRSESDCYYDSEGLECDGKSAAYKKGTYLKIKYCPFCGKKINSKSFELMKAKEDLEKAKKTRNELNEELKYNGLFVEFRWCGEYGINEELSEKYTIEEIIAKYRKVECILYTRVTYIGNIYNTGPFITKDTKIAISSYFQPRFYSRTYIITEEEYNKLIDLGIAQNKDKEIEKLKKKEDKILDKINKLTEQIEELKKQILVLELENE